MSRPTPHGAPDPVEAYVRQLSVAVTGRPDSRQRILLETRDHLLDAAEHLASRGHPSPGAEAVRAFGPVATIAPAFRETLQARLATRAALLLLAVLCVNICAWALLTDSPAPWAFTTVVRLTEWVAVSGLALACLVLARGRWADRAGGGRGSGWVLGCTLILTCCALEVGLAVLLNAMAPSLAAAAVTLALVGLPFAYVAWVAVGSLRFSGPRRGVPRTRSW